MKMRLFLEHAFAKDCIKDNIIIALIVGTILAAINHFDRIIYMSLTKLNIIQIIVTYFVPFIVASIGSGMHGRDMELNKKRNKK